MDALPDVYIIEQFTLKNSVALLPEGTVKNSTPDYKANSKKMLTEMNESGAIAKIRFEQKVILLNN